MFDVQCLSSSSSTSSTHILAILKPASALLALLPQGWPGSSLQASAAGERQGGPEITLLYTAGVW